MFSLPSVVSAVVASQIGKNIFGGKESSPTPQVLPSRPVETNGTLDRFLDVLPDVFASIPRYEPPTQQEIILKLPEETKESGQMENGPQVYQGFAGALSPLASQAARTIGRTIFGGGAGGVAGTVGGAVTGYGVGQMMAGGDACGCGPKPFVRLDKCGRPIITRAMQAKAKDIVTCMGIEQAAAALGVDTALLAEIAFKKFKPRAKGISGAQARTARRVNRQLVSMAKMAGYKCTPMARR